MYIVFLGAVVAPLVAGALTMPASAHTDLVSSNPADGADLRSAPDELTLVFSDEMDTSLSAVSLRIGASEARPLSVRAGDSPTDLIVDVSGGPAVGSDAQMSSWRLAYRVVSADGHPVSGTVTFSAPVPERRQSGRRGPRSSDGGSTTPVKPSGGSTTNLSDGDSDGDGTRADQPWWRPLPVIGVIGLLLVLAVLGFFRIGRHEPDGDDQG